MKTINHNGKSYNAKDFALTYGIAYGTVLSKLNRENSIDSIIASPRSKKANIVYKKKTYTIEELCNKENIDCEYFIKKLTEGFTANEIIKEYNYNNKINTSDSNIDCNNKVEICKIESNNEIHRVHKDSPSDEWDLVEKISRIKDPIKNVNLIDYENVGGNCTILNEFLTEGNINIFFFNGGNHADSYYRILPNSRSYNFSVVTLKTESQLVDHLLMYYLGILSVVIKRNTNIKINIISRDSHFYKVREEIHDNRINNIGMNYSQDRNERYILSLSNYIIKNKFLNNGTSIFKNEFRTIFNNFYTIKNREFTDQALEDLIKTLLDLQFVEYHKETKTYSEYYTFNLNNVKNYIESKTRA